MTFKKSFFTLSCLIVLGLSLPACDRCKDCQPKETVMEKEQASETETSVDVKDITVEAEPTAEAMETPVETVPVEKF